MASRKDGRINHHYYNNRRRDAHRIQSLPASAALDSDRKQPSDFDLFKEQATDILLTSLPFAAVAALGAVACNACYKLFTSGPEKKTSYHPSIEKYPYIKHGWPVQVLNGLQEIARIHPNWMEPFFHQCNEIQRQTMEMDKVLRRAEALVPGGSLPKPDLRSAAMDVANDSVSLLTNMVKLTSEKLSDATEAAKKKSPVATASPAVTADSTEYMKRLGMLGELITESNEIIIAMHSSRSNFAALFTELTGAVKLYNAYWNRCGAIVMGDVDLLTMSGAIEELLELKRKLVIFLAEYGELPSEDVQPSGLDGDDDHQQPAAQAPPIPPNHFVDSAMQSALLKWWISMQTAFLPQMYYTCLDLKLSSVYNACKLKGVQYSNTMQRKRKSQTGYVSDSAAVKISQLDQGHLFLPPRSDDAAASGAATTTTAGGIGATMQQPVKRPSPSDPLLQQAGFWLRRVQAEGWQSVISSPWAGYIPATNEPCFLPMSVLSETDAMDKIQAFLSISDKLVSHVYVQQSQLVSLYMKFGNFWDPSVVESVAHLKRDAKTAKAALKAAKYWREL